MPDRPTGPSVPPAPRLVEATADRLAQRALGALPAAVGRADLAALAPPLGRLLEARMETALDLATPRSPWIEGDRVNQAREAWREAAQGALRIPATEREAEVRQAAYRALSHLVRPAQTMAAVAFEGQAEPLPVETALDRIRVFGPYPYLPQIAERYVERKGLGHIDREGLERLLRRIDRRMVGAFGADDWLALLAPLLEWVGPAGRPSGSVPAALLRPLFLAKGADDLHDALDEIDAVDAETLHALLTDALPAPTPSPPPSAPSRADAPEPTPPEPAPPADGHRRPDEEAREAPSPGDEAADDEAFDSDPTGAEPLEESEHQPPVIGSRYGSLEFEPVHESEVIGAPRPVADVPATDAPATDDLDAEGPMETVRDALADPLADPVPPVPVLDMSPALTHTPESPHTSSAPLAEAVAEPDATEPDTTERAADAPPADAVDQPLWMRLAENAADAPPSDDADEDTPLWKRFAQSDLAERLPDAEPTATLADSFVSTAATHRTPAHRMKAHRMKAPTPAGPPRRSTAWSLACWAPTPGSAASGSSPSCSAAPRTSTTARWAPSTARRPTPTPRRSSRRRCSAGAA